MSHPGNTAILENHFEDALELTSAEMVTELGLEVIGTPTLSKEAVILKGVPTIFFDTKRVLTHDDLAEMVGNKRFEEGPDGPC